MLRILILASLLLGSAVVSAAPSKPVSITCVGDSITVTQGPHNTYPAQLGRILGPNYVVNNQGDSGHTMLKNGLCGASPSGSWRRPCLEVSSTGACTGNCTYWDSNQFLNTTASGSDIITIMLGTNDAKYCNWNGPANGLPSGAGTQFAADYVSMIKLFKALPSKPKVYVVLPPPAISQCAATHYKPNGTICLAYNMSYKAINEIFPVLQRQIAIDGGADGVIDVWTALNGTNISEHATVDGIHPYPPALGVVAQTIADTITANDRHTIDTQAVWPKTPEEIPADECAIFEDDYIYQTAPVTTPRAVTPLDTKYSLLLNQTCTAALSHVPVSDDLPYTHSFGPSYPRTRKLSHCDCTPCPRLPHPYTHLTPTHSLQLPPTPASLHPTPPRTSPRCCLRRMRPTS